MAHDPSKNAEWLSSVCEARVKIALNQLWRERTDCLKNVELVITPVKYRTVRTTKALAPGQLGLVPCTTTIAMKKADDSVPNGAVRLETGFVNPSSGTKYTAVLMPSGGFKLQSSGASAGASSGGFNALKATLGSLVVPYWFVITTDDAAGANVDVTKATVDGVSVPIIRNKKALATGAELVVYVPPAAPVNAKAPAKDKGHPKTKAPEPTAPAPKRAKHR